jgi:hypothetical protein
LRTNTKLRRKQETQAKVAEATATIATTAEMVAITTTETASKVVEATAMIAMIAMTAMIEIAEMVAAVSKRPNNTKKRTLKEVGATMARAAEKIETNADQLMSKKVIKK